MSLVPDFILYYFIFKGGVSGGSVGGGVVFMSREVTGPVMRWCYADYKERDSVLDECLTLLHYTLEASELSEYCFSQSTAACYL